MNNSKYGLLHPLAMGLAIGVLWSFSVVCLAVMAGQFGMGIGIQQALSIFYIGYGIDIVGILIGSVWGLIDGFIGGLLIGLLYNFFAKRLMS